MPGHKFLWLKSVSPYTVSCVLFKLDLLPHLQVRTRTLRDRMQAVENYSYVIVLDLRFRSSDSESSGSGAIRMFYC